MRDVDRLLLTETVPEVPAEEIGEFPLPVAEDWDVLVSKAEKMTDVIDRHLDFESKLQGRELRPNTLCPEQKVSLVSDLTAV
ncbi:MAG: hypothetical protein ABFD54_01095 [Armatimonadota bacterium]|nr:hypothetical protein [bacterium]